MRATYAGVLLASALLAACGSDGSPDPTEPTNTSMSLVAQNYLKQALDFEQEVFLYRSKINWTTMRADVNAHAGSAQTRKDTYDDIAYSIERYFVPLGDPHTALWPPEHAPGRVDSPSNDPRLLVSGSLIAPNVAYLNMPTFSGRNPTGRADSTLTEIRRLDASKPCGWIVDLRLNPGGTWSAMISGLSPLLGADGTFGGLVDADSARLLFYKQGLESGILDPSDNRRYPQVRATSGYTLSRTNAPVALLQGPLTASAGELIILALRGSSVPVRTFGTPTYGLTTTPVGIYMVPDSAYLNITAAVMFDRTGKIYGSVINPDKTVASNPRVPDVGTRDETVNAALAWLASRPECSTGGVIAAQRAPLPSGAVAENLPGRPSPNARPELVSRYFLPR